MSCEWLGAVRENASIRGMTGSCVNGAVVGVDMACRSSEGRDSLIKVVIIIYSDF